MADNEPVAAPPKAGGLDISTPLGLVLAISALLGAFFMEKNHIGDLGGLPVFFAPLLNISAAFIVFGGTLAAAMISFPMTTFLKLPSLLIKTTAQAAEGGPELVALFLRLAEKARRQGLLALEDEANAIHDDFLKKGIMLVVDGTDPEVVRSVLEIDSAVLHERHKAGYELLEAMGGYSPTMGIIGTVMGLVSVLSDLSDVSRLGPAIAVAFIATLYGVGTANIVWLPLGSKLKRKSESELAGREMMLEGILSIQAGDNPRIVQEKLAGYLAPKIRPHEEETAGAGAGAR
jgi:chemotaxis protein MotA